MTDRIPLKICGLTRVEDARLAWELGASALGFIFHPRSPRCVSTARVVEIRRALPPDAFCVGVFVDRPAEEVNYIAKRAKLNAVQLHGHETPETCALVEPPIIKVIRTEDEDRLDAFNVTAFLLDAAHPTLLGGTGIQADWTLASRIALRKPLILAGGLDPKNIRAALEAVHPMALDVNSGVESAPGIKDPALLKSLFKQFEPSGERPCLLQA